MEFDEIVQSGCSENDWILVVIWVVCR